MSYNLLGSCRVNHFVVFNLNSTVVCFPTQGFCSRKAMNSIVTGLFENKNLEADRRNTPSIRYLPARQVSNTAWLSDCCEWQHSPQLNSEEIVEISFGEEIVIFNNLWLQGPPGGCFVYQPVVVWPKPNPDIFSNIGQWSCHIPTKLKHCYCCGYCCTLSKWASGILNNCKEPVVSHRGQTVENAKGLLVGNFERAPSHLFVDLEAPFT